MVEMALVLGQNRVGIARSDNPTTVPNHPVARLMFYFDCICTVLQITDEYAARLRDYMNFYLLTESEMDKLLYFCWLFSPDELINKCIFLNDDLCGEYENGFFELSEITERLLVTDSLMIGNQQRRVKKVMAFKVIFLLKNYYIPIEIYKERLHILLLAMNIIMQERRRIAGVDGASETPIRTTNTSSCCIIL